MLMNTKKHIFQFRYSEETKKREKAPLISLVHVSPCYKNILLREFNCIITDYEEAKKNQISYTFF